MGVNVSRYEREYMKFHNFTWKIIAVTYASYIFIFYEYIANSQTDHLPFALIAQFGRALHYYYMCHGFQSPFKPKLFSDCLRAIA